MTTPKLPSSTTGPTPIVVNENLLLTREGIARKLWNLDVIHCRMKNSFTEKMLQELAEKSCKSKALYYIKLLRSIARAEAPPLHGSKSGESP